MPFEPAAEVREHRYVNVAAMAANVVAMAAASAMQDRKDTDARMEREKAIGEQMMRDFKALAAEWGVEVPAEIGGTGGWLHMLRWNHPGLAGDWEEYKRATKWKGRRFTQLFQWGYTPDIAMVALGRNRQNQLAKVSTIYAALRDILETKGERALADYIVSKTNAKR